MSDITVSPTDNPYSLEDKATVCCLANVIELVSSVMCRVANKDVSGSLESSIVTKQLVINIACNEIKQAMFK